MSEQPLSPHLQVYKPQLTSILSITHRGTGVFLSIGALFVVYYIYALSTGPASHAQAQALLGHWMGQVVLWALVFSVWFHLGNGLRHLFWDMGRGLELDAAYLSGWLVVAFSILATVTTWYLFTGGVL